METEPITPKIETNTESRFGNKEQIVEAMTTGEIIEIGKIEDFYTDIPEHANVVNIADVKRKDANEILGVKIQKSGEVIRCIFKPADGENQKTKLETALSNEFKFYPRECAAYMISEHFDLDVVPPTIIREINGRTGALQLFLDHEYYKNFHYAEGTEETQAIESEDWQKIAVLDWILANCERHAHNMMIAKDNPQKIAAIDHGIILCGTNYFEMAVRGPALQLTYQEIKNGKNIIGEPKQTKIPKPLTEKIQDGIVHRKELDDKLQNIEGLDKHEIDDMWKRAQQLIDSGKFLSKLNFRTVFGHEWLSDQYRK